EDDLAAAIASVLSTRSVNGKPVFVRFARRPQDVRGCQIVYIAGSEIAHQGEIVEALKGTPTLTLADLDGFATHGGMVDFTGVAPNLRFEICLARADEAGLKISSRLLSLAHVVTPSP
ncbi:MAG TPA: YfiR family protein, partial [Candidatus Acidoferrales bacterium]|nr:YfiR family protein [Candidatus Acidoferrales bacterium]